LTLDLLRARPTPACALSGRTNLPRAPATGPRIFAGAQIGLSGLIGTGIATLIASASKWWLLPLLAWDISAVVYMAWVWTTIWKLDAERTAQYAVPVDPTRAAADALVLGAAVVSLLAVALLLGRAAGEQGTAQVVYACLGVASVVCSWGMVHTVYTLRYARLYYTGEDGGADFQDPEPPTYSDFAYLSFTVGMTFQVSDTDLQDRGFRRTVLTHALLSYLFGTGILAMVINLMATISSAG
jgi:uncharacterized membrane protein